ncbi:DUF3100 domain-containing protein [Bradyrhizobium sp. CCGUVB1N3]|uniref:DUF3100 domain-containing protein n=1 Tax=Bradyrhizobium sp. CCGUVB1N3 TaxID=2949629 RepID=UPI0020B325DF|nr:DUF3100 domain-containing protein [Bradyrhizobium sp. CCGUVB1N3]MCP3469141.1 DUF3100 domain-containing protein [Bradyrhizobium sp. CCGUVB1N3]
MSNVTSASPTGVDVGWAGLPRVFVGVGVTVLFAELIGAVTVPLGGSYKVVLLPLLWALLIGAAWGLASPRLPAVIRFDARTQAVAGAALQPALLLFVAKLGLLVGGSLPKILAAGWALVFQEFGHFFGTMVFGLPLALLLGIKREAIGATFSVGREPSLAIIGEKYGMNSPEGRGVLAEYMTGTIFGTVFIAIFAGVVTGLGIFDPLALAMGAGVGSGSLMAAASGAIAAQQTPEVAKDVAAFAAASNLITTTVGTYFTLFLSLPFTVWAYGVLEPILGRRQTTSEPLPPPEASVPASSHQPATTFSAVEFLSIWLVSALVALVGNYIAYKTVPDVSVLAGAAMIVAAVVAGHLVYVLTKRVVPAVVWVSLVAMALTYPTTPFAADVAAITGKINFLALATPLLAFAGLSIAKDLPAFRSLGWRIVVVSLMANAGTFLGATIIAQFFMHKPV